MQKEKKRAVNSEVVNLVGFTTSEILGPSSIISDS